MTVGNYTLGTIVSVPIWGLFNLTHNWLFLIMEEFYNEVSVPIWGLFNLTYRYGYQ